ncbi:hypothetical protein [Enterococcus sp.]|uniref:hypothetical protein n=1 Tax=Enterococcus sp. TaxID=35783 RepID=UPI0028A2621A|nr:hypothetical protein [Enterococcus sp.]
MKKKILGVLFVGLIGLSVVTSANAAANLKVIPTVSGSTRTVSTSATANAMPVRERVFARVGSNTNYSPWQLVGPMFAGRTGPASQTWGGGVQRQ